MEKGKRTWSPAGRRAARRLPLRLVNRILVITAIVGLFHLGDLHVTFRSAIQAKYSPTQFSSLTSDEEVLLARQGWQAEAVENTDRARFLSNRPRWKHLGGGHEGDVYLFNNSIIKIFNEGNSPLRNCVPGAQQTRWPTEIPATLLLGGHGGLDRESLSIHEEESDPFSSMFVPVQDYFLTSPRDHEPPKWHLVTPFLRAGTAEKLAHDLSTAPEPFDHLEIDRTYRPAFNALLSALAHMHTAHNLCHDDVKLDNIFIASRTDSTRWVFADLGNARQPDHPYHASALWTADTDQHRDCRINDAVRLTKSYLQFVRGAAADRAAFDEAFFRGEAPLSRLYWSVVGEPPAKAAVGVRERSVMYAPYVDGWEAPGAALRLPESARPPAGAFRRVLGFLLGAENAAAVEVSRTLRIGAKERLGRVFGMTGLLGVPKSGCA
ncbi:hypothetical protein HYQ45_007624 [Verticillium longisporum]|uniref:Protein kinase domain-containing protein n=2 Tax=Verticillium TaxID=1036719 RepID=A0A2J8ENW0_VERDA|nr:Translocation protein sec66 [Verticillium dahliae VDG2]KAG7134363.1 hypothetical protein HYQ45_007624 [Verticillium longisporum]PNH28307.1 hypothetical protein BJF96_g8424 [Verticillium dahliae]PNH37590.1 hypothetical protein VD0004_g9199 [Verticillium dahliae]PNH50841.1 hypothetical protein VD0003_g6367 [Verticillium dahliae]